MPRTTDRWLSTLVVLTAVLYSASCGEPAAHLEEVEAATFPSGCQPHIEVHAGEHWAEQLGRPVWAVLQDHRVALWAAPGPSPGNRVGELRVGARALIIGEAEDAYRVRNPLDGTVGWVSKNDVARTQARDVDSLQPCDP